MRSTSSKLPTATINNRLLRALPQAELDWILPRLERVELKLKNLLIIPNEIVEAVHFIESGTVSMISTLVDGSRIEVGLVGFEGMLGLPILLGSGSSLWESVVQVEGQALRIFAASFRTALAELPSLMPLLLRYLDTVQAQLAQAAACNARHPIEQRLAKWILTTQDRVQADAFPMTQEFMSVMLGVHRPGVTLGVATLKRAGLIQHERGTVHVLDRANLEAVTCECYEVVRNRFAWLMK